MLRRHRVLVWCALVAVASVCGGSIALIAAPARSHATVLSARTIPVDCDGASGFGPGTTDRTVRVAGVDRTYHVHVPAGYTGQQRYPVIIGYHGRGETSTAFEGYSQLSRLPAIVVYPDGLRGPAGVLSWQGAPYASPRADDVAFTGAILRDVRARACVDSNRVFAVGRSNGGGFVGVLACRMPSTFAAFAAVSGAFYPATTRGCATSPPVSMVEFHGTADPVVHYNGGHHFGGSYPPVTSWLQSWVRKDGCLPTPIQTTVSPTVDEFSWPLCAAIGHEVVHYRINGGSHTWPGSPATRSAKRVGHSLDATGLIWQFFQAHPRR